MTDNLHAIYTTDGSKESVFPENPMMHHTQDKIMPGEYIELEGPYLWFEMFSMSHQRLAHVDLCEMQPLINWQQHAR
jgi:hypothetical protein